MQDPENNPLLYDTLPSQRTHVGQPLKVKSSMVTIRDVAKASGFSSTTVSIVLNNAPLARYIPPTTKKKIEVAAKRLGYRPNLFAQIGRASCRERV